MCRRPTRPRWDSPPGKSPSSGSQRGRTMLATHAGNFYSTTLSSILSADDTRMACAARCNSQPGCTAFSFAPVDRTCQLTSAGAIRATEEAEHRQDRKVAVRAWTQQAEGSNTHHSSFCSGLPRNRSLSITIAIGDRDNRLLFDRLSLSYQGKQ